METTTSFHSGSMLFESVVARDHEALLRLYASNARNSLVSYLSMKSRWARQHEFYSTSEEKRDESLQQSVEDSDRGRFSPYSMARREDDSSYHYVLETLSKILASTGTGSSRNAGSLCSVKISKEADRLLWETSSILSDSRPPGDLCVFNKEGDTTPPEGNDQIPPIFDGSVANATPPPLGGASAGASGGAGTILHLACAMDQPLVLAFLLIMGADGRASHTAFRRLMVHEAACNGSIGCLSLLLELGKKFSEMFDSDALDTPTVMPFFPETMVLPGASSLTREANENPAIPSLGFNVRQMRRESDRLAIPKGDFLAALSQFSMLSKKVHRGEMKELDAARALMECVTLAESTQVSLIRSCTFHNDFMVSRSFLRPHNSADGHGNSPLHWATFKNETACVALLLQYNANPNARAHPSGWTPLHDAAYSNSSSAIEILISKGAIVDARANSGATPLCFAAQEDSAEATRLLLEKGADLTARCSGAPDHGNGNGAILPHSRFSGYTPLHYCAHYNAHKAAQVLLGHAKAKAAMETADLSGRLPIHVAVARGSSDVLRELLHAGARIDTRPLIERRAPRPAGSPNAFFALPDTPRRQPPSPEVPASPNRNRVRSRSSSTASPVTSPVLRSLIPEQPISSTKPWNCLTQQAIDECKELISKAEQSWSPDRHLLFTPRDRKAIMELLRVGKRLEQQGVLFVDLWPQVLNFCGRGWFEPVKETFKPRAIDFANNEAASDNDQGYDGSDNDSDRYLFEQRGP